MSPLRTILKDENARQRLFAISLVVLLLLAAAALFFFGDHLIPPDMNPTPPLASELNEPTKAPVDSEQPVVKSDLLISELQSSNRATLFSADGQTPDWIELYNSGSETIDLAGYTISDNLKKPQAFVFASRLIQPGERLIVFASGRQDYTANDEIHLPFKLAKSGEDLIMADPAGNIIARLVLPLIPTGLSWGLQDTAQADTSAYLFFHQPTPGRANDTKGFASAADALAAIDCPLVINEYVTSQDQWTDLDGDAPDWVELYNAGSETYELLGTFLSDDPDRPDKWPFPQVSLAPGQYLVVYLSGKAISYDPEQPTSLQADFRLSKSDNVLLLADSSGRLLLSETIVELPLNISYGRNPNEPDSWSYFPRPTPGTANDTKGFDSVADARQLAVREFWLNEVVASPSEMTTSGKNKSADWIEIYNHSDQPVDLTGYGLSDQRGNLFLETIEQIIEPRGYLVIEPTEFGVASAGETIYLTAPDGWIHDRFVTGRQPNQISSGRADPDLDVDQRFFFANATPGQPNSEQLLAGAAAKPLITLSQGDQTPAGLYPDGSLTVTLSSLQPGAAIYYTTDGREPDKNSLIYSEPFEIDRSTAIRCRSYVDGYLPSFEETRTALFDEPHDLPVISIQADPADFFDQQRGLWANYSKKIERPARIEFYEPDGSLGVSFAAGIELHGSYSRSELQKSLEIKIRSLYGDSQVTYPFFPGSEVTTFKRLILRTSGQDWQFSKLRDIFMTEVIKGFANMDTMDYRPVAVYLNGEYFGLYNLREKVDKFYAYYHYGADPDGIDMIRGVRRVMYGDGTDFQNLTAYAKSHDLRDPAAYQTVLDQIEATSLMDFVICQTFFNNLDSGNKKWWRPEGGQWRYVFFDLDWAMFPSTYTLNILKYDLLDPKGHGQQDIFDTTLQVKLMQNPEFKKEFIERYAWFLNTVFQPERMLTILDRLTEEIRSEMPRHIARWGKPSSVASWEWQVGELSRITSEKRDRTIKILQDSFDLNMNEMRELFPEDFP